MYYHEYSVHGHTYGLCMALCGCVGICVWAYGLMCMCVYGSVCTFVYRCICTTLCGRIKGKGRDTNLMCPWGGGCGWFVPWGWCRSLYRHNKATIDCGFEFVDNIESINLNLLNVSLQEATIDCGFAFVNNIESLNLNFIVGCFLVFPCGGGVSGA